MTDRSKTAAGWDAESLRTPHQRADKAARVRDMFNAIAGTYERVNTIATLGRDNSWRRRAVAAADVQPTDVVLDVACGTGDMIRTFATARPPPARIIGLDFAREMLARGRYDRLTVPYELIEGDALALPLAGASVDVVSCAFGVRNFQSLQAGLAEMARVLRPGGRVIILEFVQPENALLQRFVHWYTHTVLPWLGGLLARDQVGAYRYLPRSVETFESRASMVARLQDAGFTRVTTRVMNFGDVVLYRGVRLADEPLPAG